MEILTIEKARELIGKDIKWKAPIYEHNEGYYGMGYDGGIAVIESVSEEGKIQSNTIDGADLSCVGIEHFTLIPHEIEWCRKEGYMQHIEGDGNNNCYYFSDNDRGVSFEEIIFNAEDQGR